MATVRQPVPEDVPNADSASKGDSPLAVREPAGSSIDPNSVSQRFEALLKRVQANRPNEDVALLRKAWEFCVKHHEGQMRASGEPYIIHPLEVAEVLAEMRMDATS